MKAKSVVDEKELNNMQAKHLAMWAEEDARYNALSPAEKRKEWLKQALAGFPDDSNIYFIIDDLYIKPLFRAYEAKPVPDEVFIDTLRCNGVLAKYCKMLLQAAKDGTWEKVLNEWDGVGCMPRMRYKALITRMADGNHEWDRVYWYWYSYASSQGDYISDKGWKRIRKAFDKGGYEAATEMLNK